MTTKIAAGALDFVRWRYDVDRDAAGLDRANDKNVHGRRPGAHTIKKHVGKTIQQLKLRLADEPRLRRSSSFSSLDVAERAVSDAIAANIDDIRAWASLAQAGEKENWAAYDCGKVIGQVVIKRTGQIMDATNVTIVLKERQSLGKVFYVFTASPGV